MKLKLASSLFDARLCLAEDARPRNRCRAMDAVSKHFRKTPPPTPVQKCKERQSQRSKLPPTRSAQVAYRAHSRRSNKIDAKRTSARLKLHNFRFANVRCLAQSDLLTYWRRRLSQKLSYKTALYCYPMNHRPLWISNFTEPSSRILSSSD